VIRQHKSGWPFQNNLKSEYPEFLSMSVKHYNITRHQKAKGLIEASLIFIGETLTDAVEEGYQSTSANGGTSVQFGEGG
jgi:hypothetical protein